MKKNLILMLMVITLLLVGCATTVSRTAVDEATDFSGRWNDTDSRMVAEQMVKDVIYRNWITDFVMDNDEKPVVIVGTIRNRSSEHIDTSIFIKDIERELINSGKVKFVATSTERRQIIEERYHQQSHASVETAASIAQETGADFMLIGEISSITDAISGKVAIFYQVDLELVNIETNEKIWMGNKKIKKIISRSKTKW
ncbi:MAG: penicillin-binding protein activator LpoB [Candidatus Cloacimonetes bacterium]|nr:penicillin-binding protein activator LpoB [Candidatus Cloacimonadota bacterium]